MRPVGPRNYHAVMVDKRTAMVRVAPPLRFLLPVRHRHGEVTVEVDGATSLTHLIEALGVPRTEVGSVVVNGRPATLQDRPRPGDVIDVPPVVRPQALPAARFVLDVHLGTLARWMRLLGIDTAYRNDASDPELVEQGNAEGRVVLTKDRGLLRRRELDAGAYVLGSSPEDQLADVLDRFAPPLAPWTRCLACNGGLEPVDKQHVEHLLEPGTRASYDDFSRCLECAQLYWHGAHADRLSALVELARRSAGAPRDPERAGDRARIQ
jgi:uncharacterized protein with PIN domain